MKGYSKWYDVDLLETIELKKEFFIEDDNYQLIASDIFSDEWINSIEQNEELILLCEGTLMYFSEQRIKNLFRKLRNRMPECDMVFEIMGSFGKNKIHPFVKKLGLKNKYKWGIRSKRWFNKNNLDLFYSESFLERYQQKWGIATKILNLLPSLKLKLASQIYHFKFK